MTDSTRKTPIFYLLALAAMLCMPAVGAAATAVRLAVTADAMTLASGLVLSSSSLTLMLSFVRRRRKGGLPLVLLLLPMGVVSLTLLAACDGAPMP